MNDSEVKLPGKYKPREVVYHGDHIVKAPADYSEVRGIGSPHLVRSTSLRVELLASNQLHLRTLHQTFALEDSIHCGLRWYPKTRQLAKRESSS